MTKLATLAGVAHDIGHHAQSGLACLYPHLGQACESAGTLSATIDLLSERPYPVGLPQREPLWLALGALRETFIHLLETHGFLLSDLTVASLEFTFPQGYGDYSFYRVRSVLTAKGRTFEFVHRAIDESPGPA